jgi:hypothetical protein
MLTRIGPDVIIIKRAKDVVRSDGSREVEVEVRTATNPRPSWYAVIREPSGKVTARTADPGSLIDFHTWVAAVRSGTDLAGAPPLRRARVLVD